VQDVTKQAHDGRPSGGVFDRRVFARARRLCLRLPDSSEKVAWGHPTFKAGQKMFCAFEIIRERPSIAFRLPAKEASAALKDVRCFASPYGRGLWVSVWVDGDVDWNQLEQFLLRSYRTVATKRQLAALVVPR
jgi:predicted DNA-binding protein (MmcQ/YjbR family)